MHATAWYTFMQDSCISRVAGGRAALRSCVQPETSPQPASSALSTPATKMPHAPSSPTGPVGSHPPTLSPSASQTTAWASSPQRPPRHRNAGGRAARRICVQPETSPPPANSGLSMHVTALRHVRCSLMVTATGRPRLPCSSALTIQ